jgi:hypothetical protein
MVSRVALFVLMAAGVHGLRDTNGTKCEGGASCGECCCKDMREDNFYKRPGRPDICEGTNFGIGHYNKYGNKKCGECNKGEVMDCAEVVEDKSTITDSCCVFRHPTILLGATRSFQLVFVHIPWYDKSKYIPGGCSDISVYKGLDKGFIEGGEVCMNCCEEKKVMRGGDHQQFMRLRGDDWETDGAAACASACP